MIILIPGQPKAQQRHRNCTKQGKSWLYDPSASDKRAVQKSIKNFASSFNSKVEGYCLHLGFRFFTKPLSKFRIAEKKLCSQERLVNTYKPDIDNYVKFYMDAMTGVFYDDDAFVQLSYAVKYFSDQPRTEIELTLQPIQLQEAPVFHQALRDWLSKDGIKTEVSMFLNV